MISRALLPMSARLRGDALVYDGDRVVAWAEFGSPEVLPDIHHRKEYLANAERLPDYRVTCILVERGLRGQGLAAIALR